MKGNCSDGEIVRLQTGCFFFLGGGHSRGDVDGMVKVVYRRSVFKICVVGDSSFVVVFRV